MLVAGKHEQMKPILSSINLIAADIRQPAHPACIQAMITHTATLCLTKSEVTSLECMNWTTAQRRKHVTPVAIPPAPSTAAILIFFCNGACSDQINSMGRIRIIKSVKKPRVVSAMKILRWLRHEPCTESSQKALIGEQMKVFEICIGR